MRIPTSESTRDIAAPIGRARRALLLALFAAVLAFALAPASAQAHLAHPYLFSFGSFRDPEALAVDQATGDVYVVSPDAGTVSRFDSSGNPVPFTASEPYVSGNTLTGDSGGPYKFDASGSADQVAIDNSGGVTNGDIYVTNPYGGGVDIYNSTGAQIGKLTGPYGESCGVATTPAGEVIVGDYGDSNVDEYVPSANPVTDANLVTTIADPDKPCYVAADGAGNVYAQTWANGPVLNLSTAATVVDATARAIYVDPASGHLFVDEGPGVSEFDAAGNLQPAGLVTRSSNSRGVAVSDFSGSQGDVYVANADAGKVDVFGPATTLPDVVTGAASQVMPTSASVAGTVDPASTTLAATCTVQYGTSTSYGQSVPCTPASIAAGSGVTPITATLTGLTPNTTYHYSVVGANTNGASAGQDATFTTTGPPAVDGESASNVLGTSATLNAEINPDGFDTTCVFKIVDDSDFLDNGGFGAPQTQTLACSPSDLGSGTSDVGASAQATGLSAGTLYDFEVIATNSQGPVDGSATQFETTPPLTVDFESVTHVTTTSAALSAEVNALGTDTKVQFQYETDATFQASPPGSRFENAITVPASAIDIGSGTSDVAASTDLTGLTPGTKYHFRAVGVNSAGTEDGAARAFTTLVSIPVVGLPDGRAYELVSPVNKSGGEPYWRALFAGDQAAASGAAVAYVGLSPFPGGAGPSINDLAVRTSGGWVSQPILPAQAPGVTLELPSYGAFSSDLSKALLSNGGATVGGITGQDYPPLVPGTCTTPLFPTPPAAPTTPCTGEPTGFDNLFVRDDTSGSFQLVNSLAQAPSGVTPAAATELGMSADGSTVVFSESAPLTALAPTGQSDLYAWSSGTGAVTLLGANPSGALTASGRVLNAVSANGSRIFFTDSSGNLNVFQGGSATQIDKPASGGAGPGGGGQFMTALADGSVVFFTDGDGAGLTSDTVSGSGTNLYAYNSGTGALTDLTGSSATPAACQPLTSNCAGVQGVLGAGGSTGDYFVYLVAEGVLTAAANSQGQTAQAGGENLYVENDNGGTVTTKFIAALSGGDGSDWNGQYTARVTPDGTHAAFDSVQPLTGFDNTDANTGGADTEIFLYSEASNGLVCASCNPTGNPIGSSQLDPIESGLISGGNQYLQHNLSDDGSRVFFDSSDDLSPHDTNGQQDVYEYENGQDYLISSGTSDDSSAFLDASASGNDVFFMTREALVPQDTDGLYDVYDARVNGGFPVSVTVPCAGENCKPAVTPAPAPPTVASVSFVGPGNPTPGPAVATVAVSSKKVLKGFRFSVVVLVPGKGKITISGAGLKTVTKSVKGAGRFKLTVGLTKAERNALTKKGKRKLKITVQVGYRPATGSSSTASFSITVKA